MNRYGRGLVFAGLLALSAIVLLGVGLPYNSVRARAGELEGYLPAGLEARVSIHDLKFDPATLNVIVGTTVVWTNNDTQSHTATSTTTDEPFNVRTLSPGQSGSYTFTKAGSFSYICEIHPNMSGTIVVSDPASGISSETPAASATLAGS